MNKEHDEKPAERTLTPPVTNLADDSPAVQLLPNNLFPITTRQSQGKRKGTTN